MGKDGDSSLKRRRGFTNTKLANTCKQHQIQSQIYSTDQKIYTVQTKKYTVQNKN